MRIEVKELDSILLIVYQVDPPTERDIANFEGRDTYTTDLLFRVDAHLRGGGSRVVVDVSLMSYDGELIGTLMQMVTVKTSWDLKCGHRFYGECLSRGAEVYKSREAKSKDARYVWAFSYVEGVWRVTRVYQAEQAGKFMDLVHQSNILKMYQSIQAGE